MSALKTELHNLARAFVLARLENAKEVIRSAEDSAAADTKSSAGDKYETGREMLQQEKNRAMAQLTAANKLLISLNHVSTAGNSDKVEEGSIVQTDNGNFYLAVSAGALTFKGETFFAISAASPIGAKMLGLKGDEGFELNGKRYHILKIQ